MKLKTIRACSKDPAKRTTSAPALYIESPGVNALATSQPASQLFPLPLGSDKAAVSTPERNAALMNLVWKGWSVMVGNITRNRLVALWRGAPVLVQGSLAPPYAYEGVSPSAGTARRGAEVS